MFAPLEFPRITPGETQEEMRDASTEHSGERRLNTKYLHY